MTTHLKTCSKVVQMVLFCLNISVTQTFTSDIPEINVYCVDDKEMGNDVIACM